MTVRAKNSPVGEVECPYRDCKHVCKVYKFRPRTERRTHFTNKYYAECPDHGRIGSDGNPASTEYILNKGKMWGPKQSAAAPEKHAEKSAPAHAPASKPKGAPVRTPVRSTPSKTPDRSPAQEPDPKRTRWWDTLI